VIKRRRHLGGRILLCLLNTIACVWAHPAAWFRRYGPDELPQRFERIVQSWDTANKASELSDFSVCTSWGVLGKNLYLIDVLRRAWNIPS
jgi:hypothetical protein